MKKIAVFPGSFSPLTKGHKSIIDRMIPLFDIIIIAIGINSSKNNQFDLENRINWINHIYNDSENIKVLSYDGLTVDLCKKMNAKYIIRGVRDMNDFKFESKIAQNNRELNSDIETLLINTLPKNSHISSSIVRDIIKNKGDVSKLIPNHEDYKLFFKK
jgi:pantetheine-phosphate adenylyltransferase